MKVRFKPLFTIHVFVMKIVALLLFLSIKQSVFCNCKEIRSYSILVDSVNKTNNYRFPLLGYGTGYLSDNAVKLITMALEVGIRMIDTGQAKEWYNETAAGVAVKAWCTTYPTTKVAIVTKIHPRDFSLTKMTKAMHLSRERLKNQPDDKVDIAILNGPGCPKDACTKAEMAITWETGWKNLVTLRKRGMVRFIGVSNFPDEMLQYLFTMAKDAKEKVHIVENWMDPFEQDLKALARVKEYGAVYLAFSPLGGRRGMPPDQNPITNNQVLVAIGEKHGISAAQVTLSWILQSGAAVIPRPSQQAHFDELKVFLANQTKGKLKVFLDADDLKQIASLDGTLKA